jgi:hypothetical protein
LFFAAAGLPNQKRPYCNDHKYDKSDHLTEDPNYFYHYDFESNLVFKEFKKPLGYSSFGRTFLQKEHGIKFPWPRAGFTNTLPARVGARDDPAARQDDVRLRHAGTARLQGGKAHPYPLAVGR